MIDERAWELERASRTDPSLIDREELLALMECGIWSVRMHVCRMLGRVTWPPGDYEIARDFALTQARDTNAFVRAWALEALASFACFDADLRQRVIEMLEDALGRDKPSVRVCARRGLKRIMDAT